jgi:hypothetical protein
LKESQQLKKSKVQIPSLLNLNGIPYFFSDINSWKADKCFSTGFSITLKALPNRIAKNLL